MFLERRGHLRARPPHQDLKTGRGPDGHGRRAVGGGFRPNAERGRLVGPARGERSQCSPVARPARAELPRRAASRRRPRQPGSQALHRPRARRGARRAARSVPRPCPATVFPQVPGRAGSRLLPSASASLASPGATRAARAFRRVCRALSFFASLCHDGPRRAPGLPSRAARRCPVCRILDALENSSPAPKRGSEAAPVGERSRPEKPPWSEGAGPCGASRQARRGWEQGRG